MIMSFMIIDFFKKLFFLIDDFNAQQNYNKSGIIHQK